MSVKRVAIVGKAPSTRSLLPVDDEGLEIWSLSDNFVNLPRWSRWFELHDLNRYRENKHYWNFLTADHGGKPIYISDPPTDEMPSAVRLPFDELLTRFGRLTGGRYYTNSIAYMTALAIHEGFEEIHLYGVEMEQDSTFNREYSHQRPSCEYWLGLAEGMGIKVVVPAESILLKTARLYGLEANRGSVDCKLREREKELRLRIVDCEHNWKQAERCQFLATGATVAFNEAIAHFNDPNVNGQFGDLMANRAAEMAQESEQHKKQAARLMEMKFKLDGALEDVTWVRQLT